MSSTTHNDVELVETATYDDRSFSIPGPPSQAPSRAHTIIGPPSQPPSRGNTVVDPPNYPPPSRSNTIGPPPDHPPPSRSNTLAPPSYPPPPTPIAAATMLLQGLRSAGGGSVSGGSGNFDSAPAAAAVRNPVPRALARATPGVSANNSGAHPSLQRPHHSSDVEHHAALRALDPSLTPNPLLSAAATRYSTEEFARNQSSRQNSANPSLDHDLRSASTASAIPGPPSQPPSRSATILPPVDPPSRAHTVVGAPWWPAPRGMTIPGPPSQPPSRGVSMMDRRLTDPTMQPSESTETEEEYLARLKREFLLERGRYCTCLPKPARYLLLLLLIGACIVLVIMGLRLPEMMKAAERSHLEKSLQLTSEGMGSSKWDDFLVERTPHNVYLFNFTNLAAVLSFGDKPAFEELGPLRFTRVVYKLDVNESLDTGEVSWTDLTLFEIADEETRSMLEQKIVTFNVNYIGGMAQVSRQLSVPQNPREGFIMPQPISISDENFNLYAISNSVLPSIRSAFLDPSSPLQAAMRSLVLPLYFQAGVQTIAATLSQTAGQVLQAWGSGTKYDASSTPSLAAWEGFSLPGALSNPSVQAPLLWDQTNDLSIASGSWLKLSSDPLIEELIKSKNQLTAADFLLVAGWMKSLTAAENTKYEAATCGVLRQMLSSNVGWIASSPPGNAADFLPRSWREIGALQFGTGLLSTLLSGDSAAISAGLPSSLVDLLGASAGLGATEGHKEPMEFPAGALFYPDPYGLLTRSSPSLRLSISNSSFLLDSFAPSAAINEDPGAMSRMYGGAIKALGNVFGNPLDFMRTSLQRWEFLQSTNPPSIPTEALPLVRGILNADASNAHALHAYLSRYIGSIFVGDPSLLDASTGLPPQNAGLFSLQSMRDHVFGYTNRQRFVISGILGLEAGAKSMEEYIAMARANTQGRTYAQRTGALSPNLQDVATYTQYASLRQYQYGCEYHYSQGVSGCITQQQRLANNYLIWGEPEVVAGASDGVRFPPFHELAPLPTLYLFVNEIKRVLPFLFSGEMIDIKGIPAARYMLDEGVTNSTLLGPPFQSRWRNDGVYSTSRGHGVPDGFINISPLQGGVPIFASYPRFYLGDPTEKNKIVMANASAELHGCWLDVEPLTGLSVSTNKRLQANVRLQASDFSWGLDPRSSPQSTLQAQPGMYAGLFARDSHVYLPFYWAEEVSLISDAGAREFKTEIYGKRKWAQAGKWIMVVGGLVLGVVFLAMLLFALKPVSIPEAETKEQ